jgi:hypothetical protein
VLLHHSLRQVRWHLRLAHGGLVLRGGKALCLLLVVASLGAAAGHAILRRGAWPDADDDDDMAAVEI